MNTVTQCKCLIVVPVYTSLTPVEMVTLRHNAEVLRGYTFVVIGPLSETSAITKARQIIESAGAKAEFRRFEEGYFRGIHGYNRLLKSHKFFYKFQDAEFILICQLDAVVLQDRLEKWILEGYDFIGAPFFEGMARPKLPPKFIKGANGGLSLRRVESSIHVLNKISSSLPSYICKQLLWKIFGWLFRLYQIPKRDFISLRGNEDLFWTIEVPKFFPDFNVAPAEISRKFSYDVLPDFIHKLNQGELPFGCHAWRRFNEAFWLQKFPSKLSKDLVAVMKEVETKSHPANK